MHRRKELVKNNSVNQNRRGRWGNIGSGVSFKGQKPDDPPTEETSQTVSESSGAVNGLPDWENPITSAESPRTKTDGKLLSQSTKSLQDAIRPLPFGSKAKQQAIPIPAGLYAKGSQDEPEDELRDMIVTCGESVSSIGDITYEGFESDEFRRHGYTWRSGGSPRRNPVKFGKPSALPPLSETIYSRSEDEYQSSRHTSQRPYSRNDEIQSSSQYGPRHHSGLALRRDIDPRSARLAEERADPYSRRYNDDMRHSPYAETTSRHSYSTRNQWPSTEIDAQTSGREALRSQPTDGISPEYFSSHYHSRVQPPPDDYFRPDRSQGPPPFEADRATFASGDSRPKFIWKKAPNNRWYKAPIEDGDDENGAMVHVVQNDEYLDEGAHPDDFVSPRDATQRRYLDPTSERAKRLERIEQEMLEEAMQRSLQESSSIDSVRRAEMEQETALLQIAMERSLQETSVNRNKEKSSLHHASRMPGPEFQPEQSHRSFQTFGSSYFEASYTRDSVFDSPRQPCRRLMLAENAGLPIAAATGIAASFDQVNGRRASDENVASDDNIADGRHPRIPYQESAPSQNTSHGSGSNSVGSGSRRVEATQVAPDSTEEGKFIWKRGPNNRWLKCPVVDEGEETEDQRLQRLEREMMEEAFQRSMEDQRRRQFEQH